MRPSAKRLISLLTASAVIFLLAAAPASAADGTAVDTVQDRDGSSCITVTDPSGQTTVTVRLPSSVAGRAANGGGAVVLPVQGIYASQNIDRAPAVTVNTSGVNGVTVDIPLVNRSAGIVAVLIRSDGTEQIIRDTVPTRNGIAVQVNSGDTIKILDNSMSFTDTQGHWAADAVNFVSARGLFCGTGADVFSPDAEMTRGMLVTVLARYAGADLHGYTDADRVSSWAADAMSWAAGSDLLKGVTPTTLEPQGSATRAQVSAIIMRYADISKNLALCEVF